VVALILLLALAVGLYRFSGRRRTYRLSITAGQPEGSRHRIARALARASAAEGVKLRLEPTAGSEQALDLVDRGVLDLALVQGGLGLGKRANIRQVAAFHVEPLHLLVKGPLFSGVAKSLASLRGKAINLSERGSGTHALAMEVLAFAGLDLNRGEYTATSLSYSELEAEGDTARLPDAVFMVSALPSEVARQLVRRHGYRLVALPFGEAFALGDLFENSRSNPADPDEPVVKRQVYDVVIPAYTYGVEPAVPAEPLHTLGTRLLVVANKDVSIAAVGQLLDAVFSTEFARVSRPPLSISLLDLPPEEEWHPGTIEYLRGKKPLIADDLVDIVEKWVSIAGVAGGATFFIIQAGKRRYRRLRDLGFESYIHKVSEIERRAMSLESASALDLKALLELQSDLGRLKGEALDKFAEGELEGEELMSGFLAHVSDARDYLARMILHERDNLEDAAQAQGRAPQELWDEAVGEGPREMA
jgi:TRAP-type uncharacterized transport system substrate-binding protein